MEKANETHAPSESPDAEEKARLLRLLDDPDVQARLIALAEKHSSSMLREQLPETLAQAAAQFQQL